MKIFWAKCREISREKPKKVVQKFGQKFGPPVSEVLNPLVSSTVGPVVNPTLWRRYRNLLTVRKSRERHKLSQRDLVRSPSRERILEYLRSILAYFGNIIIIIVVVVIIAIVIIIIIIIVIHGHRARRWVLGQIGRGQNGTDEMVRAKCADRIIN